MDTKILHFDCSLGAAGDMIGAALLQLHPEPETVLTRLLSMGLPGLKLTLEQVEARGVIGRRLHVTIDGIDEMEERAYLRQGYQLKDAEDIIQASGLPAVVRENSIAVYRLLSAAEKEVHGEDMENIHFHPIGTLDAIVDICAACLLIHELAPERITASPIHVGGGTIKCPRGILPVPAPAAAVLLRGLPFYRSDYDGELCTPTGAAILKHFVQEYHSARPEGSLRFGYGVGHREYPQRNYVCAMLSEFEPGHIKI